jgi:hypothetical protein
MTAMTLSFAVSSVILRTSPGQGNRTLVTGGRASHRAIMSVAARLPLTDAGPPSAVTHDMAHSFDIADALPVKTDEGGESHRLPARHASHVTRGSPRIQRARGSAIRAAMAGWCLYGGLMVSVKQIQVTFDCAEPERVARFWCEVLGYVVPPPPQGFATWDDFDRALPPEQQGSAFACLDPSGAGPRLFFQRVPEGKVVKNRLHLDVRVGTGLVGDERLAALEAECARLVPLGAVRVRLLPADGDNESCLVMQDIEGNEFCLD